VLAKLADEWLMRAEGAEPRLSSRDVARGSAARPGYATGPSRIKLPEKCGCPVKLCRERRRRGEPAPAHSRMWLSELVARSSRSTRTRASQVQGDEINVLPLTRSIRTQLAVFDVVMAWSVDRLGRSLQDLVVFLNELRDLKVDLFLHKQAWMLGEQPGTLPRASH
jgi:hypothetical protein